MDLKHLLFSLLTGWKQFWEVLFTGLLWRRYFWRGEQIYWFSVLKDPRFYLRQLDLFMDCVQVEVHLRMLFPIRVVKGWIHWGRLLRFYIVITETLFCGFSWWVKFDLLSLVSSGFILVYQLSIVRKIRVPHTERAQIRLIALNNFNGNFLNLIQ